MDPPQSCNAAESLWSWTKWQWWMILSSHGDQTSNRRRHQRGICPAGFNEDFTVRVDKGLAHSLHSWADGLLMKTSCRSFACHKARGRRDNGGLARTQIETQMSTYWGWQQRSLMAPCFIAVGRRGAREELRFEDGEAGNPSATALWKLWDSG